jgi:hypothetical protein
MRMPIKNLSDKRRFSRGGKIRLGEKTKNAKGVEYPTKLAYMLFDPDDESLIPIFEGLYGKEPTSITIALASEDVEQVAPLYYRAYGAGEKLVCKGDGETAQRSIKDSGTRQQVECLGPENCEYAMSRGRGGKPGCKAVLNFQFFLPDVPVMQVFQINTSSFNSIVNINSALDILRSVAGRISLVPVELVLKPQDAVEPDTGKKITIYVLDMVIAAGLRDLDKLQPLTRQTQIDAPPPSEALPDDLYPRSQVAHDALPAPEPAVDGDEKERELLWKRWLWLRNERGLDKDNRTMRQALKEFGLDSFMAAPLDQCQAVIAFIDESTQPPQSINDLQKQMDKGKKELGKGQAEIPTDD